jgi:hypothetical protein
MAIKKGKYKGSGKNRQQWNGRRWVSKPEGFTRLDIKSKPSGTGRSRAKRTTTVKQSPGNQTDMKRGATYGNPGVFKGPGGNPDGSGQGQELKRIPAANRPKDMQEGRVYGDAGQPKAPKLPPKPKATTPTKPAAPTPKGKGTQTQQELQGTSEFIKNFSGKKGMERAVEQAKIRRDRLRKKLNMKIRSDAQKTQNRGAA